MICVGTSGKCLLGNTYYLGHWPGWQRANTPIRYRALQLLDFYHLRNIGNKGSIYLQQVLLSTHSAEQFCYLGIRAKHHPSHRDIPVGCHENCPSSPRFYQKKTDANGFAPAVTYATRLWSFCLGKLTDLVAHARAFNVWHGRLRRRPH